MYNLNLKVAVFIVVFLPSIAMAQVWLPERASREGPGIMLGDSFLLHPGLGIEGGYDTNPLRRSYAFSGAGRLRITPYIDLATRDDKRRVKDKGVIDATPPKFELRLGLAGYYDMYFSDVRAVDRQDNFGVDTKLHFVLFPRGAFSMLLDADYMRSLQPYESAAEHWSWHQIHPGIGFRIKPGGGTLSFELGYRLTMLLYEDELLSSAYNKHVHDIRYLTSWKILPKTALVSRTSFSPTIYMGTPDTTQSVDMGITGNVDSLPVRTMMGLQGLLTPKFGMSLFAGYGASFYESGDNFDGFLANGELMFFITPTANVRAGGQHDFVDSFYANYFTKSGGYLKYEHMFGGIVLASLKGDLNYRQYSTIARTTADTSVEMSDRKELWAGASLLVEVRVTDWLALFASGVYQGNFTDYANVLDVDTDNDGVDEVISIPIEFDKLEVMGGVRVHY